MAIPQYQRTVIRQVQATDMSEGNVWRELANTLDNFSSQINRTTQNIVASEKNKAIAKQKAEQESF